MTTPNEAIPWQRRHRHCLSLASHSGTVPENVAEKPMAYMTLTTYTQGPTVADSAMGSSCEGEDERR